MSNNKSVGGTRWAYAVLAVLLAAGCASAASEESGRSAPASNAGAGSGSVPSSSSDFPPPPPAGDVTTTVVGEVTTTGSISPGRQDVPGVTTSVVGEVTTTAVQGGEENGGEGEAPVDAAAPLEPGGGVVPAEVRVSEEGLERLRRVLGEDKLAAVLEEFESLDVPEPYAELHGTGSGVWLGRLAGENGFLTEEGLGKLAERRSGEELGWAAYRYSEAVLAEYANESEERMAGPRDAEVSYFDGRFVDEYSDEDVRGMAFVNRSVAEIFDRVWADNDLSTPVGAFCWAVLRFRGIQSSTNTQITGGFRPWESHNLIVWHLEREAEERGIELEWETPPVDADPVLRRVLLEVTAPEVRSVVLAPGLPSVLRPAAETLYSVYDELLALPVRRVRPTVEELSVYGRLRDLTEEEIAKIWPAELEIHYREEDAEKYWNAMDMLRDDEVREILNAECKERPLENPCPPWEVPETASLLYEACTDMMKEIFETRILLESCPLFFKADIREASYEDTRAECTVNEEAEERLNELMGELLGRESGDSVDLDSPLSSSGGGSRP